MAQTILNHQSPVHKSPITNSKSPIGNFITNRWFPLVVLYYFQHFPNFKSEPWPRLLIFPSAWTTDSHLHFCPFHWTLTACCLKSMILVLAGDNRAFFLFSRNYTNYILLKPKQRAVWQLTIGNFWLLVDNITLGSPCTEPFLKK